jgi:aspartate/methionine/tyrosine aminotransferase
MKLEPFQLERYFARHEFSAPYLLSCSDCESMTIDELLAMKPNASEQFHSLWLGYTESSGSPELRQAIAGLYDQVTADHILVHAGAEEAIFNFMNTALNPGDEVVVHAPRYQSLGEVARSIGATVISWEADPDKGWSLDIDFLKDRLTPKTRAVVINVPHNPTGFLPNPEFMSALSELSVKHEFIVFSDEVYRGLEYDSSDRLPAFADINAQAVSLGVMSKTYGLAGLRIGWIVTRNQTLYDKMADFKDYTTICNSAPSEFLATLALEHHASIAARNISIIQANLKQLQAFFDGHKNIFHWQAPKAGPIAFPQYLGGNMADFCCDLVKQAGVLLVPGSHFGHKGECFRIGFGRQNLPECLERLDSYLG